MDRVIDVRSKNHLQIQGHLDFAICDLLEVLQFCILLLGLWLILS